jgi:hypothetical protein
MLNEDELHDALLRLVNKQDLPNATRTNATEITNKLGLGRT